MFEGSRQLGIRQQVPKDESQCHKILGKIWNNRSQSKQELHFRLRFIDDPSIDPLFRAFDVKSEDLFHLRQPLDKNGSIRE